MATALPRLTAWLVRHGQSSANAGLQANGHAETPLTDLGRQQATAIAALIEQRPNRLIVSPYLRARQTAEPIQLRWPDVPFETWPIEEFTYLSPTLCEGSTVETRRPLVVAYWERADPDYIHGAGAESFRQFIGRVQAFRNRLIDLPSGYVLVVGHGQFFRAFAFCLSQGFYATPQHMHDYRVAETADPMSNGEVMVFDGAAISYFTDKI